MTLDHQSPPSRDSPPLSPKSARVSFLFLPRKLLMIPGMANQGPYRWAQTPSIHLIFGHWRDEGNVFSIEQTKGWPHDQVDSMFACDHGVMSGCDHGTRSLCSITSCVDVCSRVKCLHAPQPNCLTGSNIWHVCSR